MRLKWGDLVGFLYIGTIAGLIVLYTDQFLVLTKSYPYSMGFTKVALLATFGECLRNRIATGNWIPTRIYLRFLVWGLFGIWFTAAFPYAFAGTAIIVDGYRAVWASVWINFLGGYGPFMMFMHYWSDNVIEKGFCWPWEVLGSKEMVKWGKIVGCSLLFFWIPAHAFTFSLPIEWRILCVASLSVALGMILSFAAKVKKV